MNLELLFVIRLSEAYCYDSFRTVTVASAQSTAKVCCATKDSFMLASIALLSTITAYASSLFQCLRVTSHYGNLVDFTGYLFTNYVCRLRVTIFWPLWAPPLWTCSIPSNSCLVITQNLVALR